MQSWPQARLWRAPATLAQAGLAIRARVVVYTPDPEAAPIRAQAAEPTQAPAVVLTRGPEAGLIPDQVAVHTPGRVEVLRRRQVVGATAGLAVVARINGIGLILIVS
jgi:hypothetical protein